jgi:hypothetical protein
MAYRTYATGYGISMKIVAPYMTLGRGITHPIPFPIMTRRPLAVSPLAHAEISSLQRDSGQTSIGRGTTVP